MAPSHSTALSSWERSRDAGGQLQNPKAHQGAARGARQPLNCSPPSHGYSVG